MCPRHSSAACAGDGRGLRYKPKPHAAPDAHFGARGFFVEDSGGKEMEFVFFAFDDDGVACVGSTRDAGAYVVLLGRYVFGMFGLALENDYCRI